MDFPATQVYEDDNETSLTQKLDASSQREELKNKQVGTLTVGSTSYAINRGITKIGRHPACDIIINDQTVSKQHAEIEATSDHSSAWICDLNSSNKTKLNNSVLRPGRCYELKDGSIIDFGRMRATYKCYRPLDDSMVPETPAILRQRNQQKKVIPDTPDSSLNNSSALDQDLSTIPASQNFECQSTFRRPLLPQQSMKKSKSETLRNSPKHNNDCNEPTSSNTYGNSGEEVLKNVSIHDLETQKPLDIHEVETQVQDLDDTMHKMNVKGKIPVNIHDMETQKPFDIHEIETQVDMFENSMSKISAKGKLPENIHDMETQRPDDIPTSSVPGMMSLKITDSNNSRRESDHQKEMAQPTANEGNTEQSENTSDMETQKINRQSPVDTRTKNVSKSQDENKNENNEFPAREGQEFLKLSLTSNFDEDCKELDVSEAVIGSQNLLENIADNEIHAYTNMISPQPTAKMLSKEEAEAAAESSDEDNIFDAVTQKAPDDTEDIFNAATQLVKRKLETTFISDSETDEEGEFQNVFRQSPSKNIMNSERYKKSENNVIVNNKSNELRVQSEESKSSELSKKNLIPDSDDSDTDEEGLFAELAKKEKAAAALAADVQNNVQNNVDNGENNDSAQSRESVDIFDLPTQPIQNDVEVKDKAENEFQGEVEVSNILLGKTEAGNRNSNEREVASTSEAKGKESLDVSGGNLKGDASRWSVAGKAKETEDLAPTQIIEADTNEVDGHSAVTDEAEHNKSKASTSGIDLLPTQIIYVPVTSSSNDCEDLSSDASEGAGLYSIISCGIEDIEYEMAPTQVIGEDTESNCKMNPDSTENIKESSEEKREDKSGEKSGEKSGDKSEEKSVDKSKQKGKVNLNDTIERNLNDMFGDTSDKEIDDETTFLSTQALENALHPSQELKESPKFKSNVRKRKTQSKRATPTRQKKNSGKLDKSEIKDSNADSQNSETYFSNITSRQKKNILKDSQDSVRSTEIAPVSEERCRDVNTEAEAVGSENGSKSNELSYNKNGMEDKEQKSSKESTVDDVSSSKETTSVFDLCNVPLSPEKVHSSVLDDDDNDILAGLPEVRISGTLSNPPSPASSVSSRSNINIPPKDITKGKTTKDCRKNMRHKTNTRHSVPDTAPYFMPRRPRLTPLNNELNLPYFSGICNSDKLSVRLKRLDKEDIPAIYSSTKCMRLNGPVKDQLTPIVVLQKLCFNDCSLSLNLSLKESLHVSPRDVSKASIAQNSRSRHSKQENDDFSSVFQVANEVPDENLSSKTSKRNTVRASRSGNRSGSKVPKIEQVETNVKNESAVLKGKSRKRQINEPSGDNLKIPQDTLRLSNNRRSSINTSRQSPTIRDFFAKGSSPITNENVQSSIPKETRTENKNSADKSGKKSILPTTNIIDNKPQEKGTKRTRRRATESLNTANTSNTMENKITNYAKVQTSTPQRKRMSLQIPSPNVDITSGEESQEVAMIMECPPENTAKNTKDSKLKNQIEPATRETNNRRGRKRVMEAKDIEKTSNVSSIMDPSPFEVPISKPKRAKLAQNSSVPIAPKIKENQKTDTLSRSTRSSQNLSVDSAVSSLNVTKELNTSRSSTVTKSRGRGQKRKGGSDKQDESSMNESTSSGIDTSSETRSSTLTPTRSRRSMSSMSLSSPSKIRHKVLFTGITSNEYTKILSKLGASQVEDPSKCTVLVTDKVRRTVKFLCALAQSVPIVSVDWLIQSGKIGQFADLNNYILKDPASEIKFCFKLNTSLEKARHHKLLDGYTVVLTPSVAPPPLPELKSIISACGGKPLVRPPTSWPEKAVIISREEDLANARKFIAKAPKSVTVQSTEFILTGILKQELDFVKYKLI